MTTVLVGVGNRDRGDDAIGPLIADAIAASASDPSSSVVAVAHEGDMSLLALRWEAGDDVTIVDALLADGSAAAGAATPPVGGIAELDRSVLSTSPPLSTHGVGVADALALADRLGRTPGTLRILGVGVVDVAPGPLSAELSARLPSLVAEVATTLGPALQAGAPPGDVPCPTP